MSSSGIRGVTVRLKELPFEGFDVKVVEIVEGLSGITNSSMSSENIHLFVVVGTGVVSSGFRGSDF